MAGHWEALNATCARSTSTHPPRSVDRGAPVGARKPEPTKQRHWANTDASGLPAAPPWRGVAKRSHCPSAAPLPPTPPAQCVCGRLPRPQAPPPASAGANAATPPSTTALRGVLSGRSGRRREQIGDQFCRETSNRWGVLAGRTLPWRHCWPARPRPGGRREREEVAFRSAPVERLGLAVPVVETDCRVPPPRRNGGVGAACAPAAVQGSAGGVEPLRMRKRWQGWRRPVDLEGWPSAQLSTWRPYSLHTLHKKICHATNLATRWAGTGRQRQPRHPRCRSRGDTSPGWLCLVHCKFVFPAPLGPTHTRQSRQRQLRRHLGACG